MLFGVLALWFSIVLLLGEPSSSIHLRDAAMQLELVKPTATLLT